MSQLFNDLEFSISSEARYRIPVGSMIVQFNFEHSAVPRLEGGTTSKIYPPVTRMRRASDENVPPKQAMKARFACKQLAAKLAL